MNTETLHLILSAGLVAAAAALDVAANLMLARSDGFKKRLIGIAALALVGLAFYCLSLAVQYMDLAVAYSMWGSLGILGTSLCGWLFLRQRLKPCAFAGMGLLIIGMILLFAALCLHWVKAETVRPAARFLLGAMALFFVPYGVGLMDSYRVILDNLWAIVISGIASTIIVLLVTGQTFQSLNRRSRLRRIRHLRETAANTPDND